MVSLSCQRTARESSGLHLHSAQHHNYIITCTYRKYTRSLQNMDASKIWMPQNFGHIVVVQRCRQSLSTGKSIVNICNPWTLIPNGPKHNRHSVRLLVCLFVFCLDIPYSQIAQECTYIVVLIPHSHPAFSTASDYIGRLTCAYKSGWVRCPTPIWCTYCCHISSWDKPWVTSKHNLSSRRCVLICPNGTICWNSGITTVGWKKGNKLFFNQSSDLK